MEELNIDTRGILVQCGDGLIWLKELRGKRCLLRVGDKLGYNIEDEINRLRKDNENWDMNNRILVIAPRMMK